MRGRWISVLLTVGALLVARPVRCAVPEEFAYQGVLTDARGALVADGSYAVSFRLYDAPVGGAALWSESQNVTTRKGLFTAMLGRTTPLASVAFDKQYWLSIEVSGRELTPRTPLAASPYALGTRNAPGGGLLGVVAGLGLMGGGSSGSPVLNVGAGSGIVVSDEQVHLDMPFADARFVNSDQAGSINHDMIVGNSISVEQLQPNIVSSINGVGNDGGNITLMAGPNVSIEPDDVANTIVISAVGGVGGSGDITEVNAGTGLTGGTTAGDATLNVGIGTGILVQPDAIELDTGFTDARYIQRDEVGAVTSAVLADEGVHTEDILDGTVGVSDIGPNLVSTINGVSNDGGDIALLAGANVSIVEDDSANSITISATGGGGAGDVSGILAGDGLEGGGDVGDLTLSVGVGIGITTSADAVNLDTVYTDNRYIPRYEPGAIGYGMIADNAVTAGNVVPSILSGVNGVFNDGGDIEIAAGANVTITNDDGLNRITIAATGAGDVTGVSAGSGLTGGGLSGDLSLGIASGGVTGAHLQAGSVGSSHILDGTIGGVDVQAHSLTGDLFSYWMDLGDTGIGEGTLRMRNGNGAMLIEAYAGYYGPYFEMRDPSGTVQIRLNYDYLLGQGTITADVKNFSMTNPSDATTEIWYACPEGPEAAAYTRGTAHLVKGEADVPYPQHFADVASAEGVTIQLTPLSADSKGVAVVEKRPDGFKVRELFGGEGSYDIDYYVMAVRTGYENYRVIRPVAEASSARTNPDAAPTPR